MCCLFVFVFVSIIIVNMMVCFDGIYKVGGELRVVKVDGWCGGFG